MGLRVSGKNMDIGDAMRVHVQEKITATMARYFEGALQGHVVVEPEGSGFRSDCTLHLRSGTTIAADGRGQDAYAAFDSAAERIERRLRRHKSRLKNHHAPAGTEDGAPDLMAEQVLQAPQDDIEIEAFVPIVVAETHAQVQRLTVANAVLELDMSGSNALVFRHAGSNRVNLVYRRRDGHIGWIDPLGAHDSGTIHRPGAAQPKKP
ncbi:MAG: ribosome-associated translation inhibitor RaiA [Hyphomicrobiales bacterium]|nr:ribosome-associated translation inhibitor RaiA [Hyphomicrobiales bacterium]